MSDSGDAQPAPHTTASARSLALGVAALTLLVNAPALGFDFVNWDDELHVLSNRALLHPQSVALSEHLLTPYLGYPAPLTVLSFQLNRLAGGLDPLGYHLLNLLLFALTVATVTRIAQALGARPLHAALGGLLCAVHPLSVEVCAWVTGRKDLLAYLFLLLCMERLIVRRDAGGRALALLWLTLSLSSKPVALAIAPACWVVDRYLHHMPLKHSLRFAVLWASPICGAFGLVSVWQQREVGAVHVGRDLAWVGDALQAGYVHFSHLVYPLGLLPKYVEARALPIEPKHALLCVLMLGAIALGIWRTRARQPALAVMLTFIACVYAPVSGALPLTRQIADTYVYGPLLGVGVLTALGLGMWANVQPARERLSVFVFAALLVALLPLRLHTLERWRDGIALWTPTFERYPNSPQVCRSLGNAYIFNYPGRDPRLLNPRDAISVYRECLRRFGRPELYLKNLGMAHAMAGDFLQARTVFTEALRHAPNDASIQAQLRRLSAGPTP